jgi:hypothetical protein
MDAGLTLTSGTVKGMLYNRPSERLHESCRQASFRSR